MTNQSTIIQTEVDKFSALAKQWWDPHGPLRTLHAINPARLDFVQKQTALPAMRILDVGCGGGILCEAMAGLNAQVVGLDAAADVIRVAQEHATAAGLAIDYVHQTVERYQAPVFDIVTCMEMLEHVAAPESVIMHAARLLRPGGLLFLSTINRTWHAYATVVLAAEYVLRLLPRQTHDYDKFIKPSELAAVCRQHDLETIDIAGMRYDPISNQAVLTAGVTANYLMACRKLDRHAD